MRFLKVAVVVMGVMILAGTTTLVVVIARRVGSAPVLPASVAASLDEPVGTRIAGIAAVGDRLAVQLQGGGPDRIVLIDPRSGVVVGRVGLRAGGQ